MSKRSTMDTMDHPGEPTVRTMPAREAKQSFGKLLDDAQREPVRIERNSREVAVVLSSAEYERLVACEEFVRTRVAREEIAQSDEVRGVLEDDERREAEAKLEALLL